MPDPQVVYIVTGVVLVGLVAWVIAVLARSSSAEPARAGEGAGSAARSAVSGAPMSARRALEPEPAHPEFDEAASRDPSSSDDVPVDLEPEEEQTGPYALILVTAVGRTDPGLKRKHNEDAYVILEDHHLFVIADGMGRHAAGEVASKLCVEGVADAFNSGTKMTVADDPHLPRRANRLRNAILLSNQRILDKANEVDEYAGMGTTVVAAYFSPNNQRVYIGHVGDSRCYRVREGSLKQITRDHTLGAVGIKGKSSSILSRAVGVEPNVDVDVAMEAPLPDDIYLLCSDGLSRMVSDEEILSTIDASRENLETANAKLIELANERGGRDNITTILVRVDQPQSYSGVPPAR